MITIYNRKLRILGICRCQDYVFAVEDAAIRLSELTIGIGPFVIAPAVERKIGNAGLAELSLAPTEWKNAYWGKEKGLFAKVFENSKAMDEELHLFTTKLASYNPQALMDMKSILWEGTGHWDSLLSERAELSGKLVLSDFTKQALDKFKK